MKKKLLISAFILCAFGLNAQTKEHKFGITVAGLINHYNGNLGSSFFKFKTTCFGGGKANLGIYVNRSFDLTLGTSISHFGYCQTDADASRVSALGLKCPGCLDKLGMVELRSLMIAGNIGIKYKLANGSILNENSKFAPYVYAGLGLNYLSDNMKKKCVNVGTHLTLNTGAGIKYNITDRISFGYDLNVGCFLAEKAYSSNKPVSSEHHEDPEMEKLEKRRDLYMQNALTLGFNF
jgi:hypothetical protein